MTSVAQHIVAAVEQSVTDGALPESTTCEVNHEGRMVIEVPGKVRATIRPFLLRFNGPGTASFEYPPITETMPPGPPYVADADGPAVWHFDWEARDPDTGEQLAGKWKSHDIAEILAVLSSILAFDPDAGTDIAALRIPPRTPAAVPEPVEPVALDVDEPASDLAALGVAEIDAERVARNWPRDAKGRLAHKTRVLLAPLGEAPRQRRQPCLIIASAPRIREMPSLRLTVSDEFRVNFQHNWSIHPHLWSIAPEPTPDPSERRGRELMRRGELGLACREAGVGVDVHLMRLLSGLPMGPGDVVNDAEVAAARQIMSVLAPWKLAATARRIYDDLQVGRKTKLKPTGWEMKLAIFPHQHHQSKACILLSQSVDGAPVLKFGYTGDNSVVPLLWWRDA